MFWKCSECEETVKLTVICSPVNMTAHVRMRFPLLWAFPHLCILSFVLLPYRFRFSFLTQSEGTCFAGIIPVFQSLLLCPTSSLEWLVTFSVASLHAVLSISWEAKQRRLGSVYEARLQGFCVYRFSCLPGLRALPQARGISPGKALLIAMASQLTLCLPGSPTSRCIALLDALLLSD